MTLIFILVYLNIRRYVCIFFLEFKHYFRNYHWFCRKAIQQSSCGYLCIPIILCEWNLRHPKSLQKQLKAPKRCFYHLLNYKPYFFLISWIATFASLISPISIWYLEIVISWYISSFFRVDSFVLWHNMISFLWPYHTMNIH